MYNCWFSNSVVSLNNQSTKTKYLKKNLIGFVKFLLVSSVTTKWSEVCLNINFSSTRNMSSKIVLDQIIQIFYF